MLEDKEDGFVDIELKDEVAPNVEIKEDKVEIDSDEGEEPKRKRPSHNTRLKLQRDRLETELHAERQRAQELEKRLKEREASANEQHTQSIDYNLGTAREALKLAKARLIDAIDQGKAADVADLQEQISSITWDIKVLEANKGRVPAKAANPTDGGTTTQSSRPPQMHPRVEEWVEDNPWFKKNQAMRAAAIAIDAELRSEGREYDDDDFFDELNTRLDAVLPNRNGVAKKKESPVAGASRGAVSNSGNKVRLTPEEVREAQRLGVDLQTYAENKRRIDMRNDGGYTSIL